MRGRILTIALAVAVMAAVVCVCAPFAGAASPTAGTLTPDASGAGSVAWTGSASIGAETLSSDQGAKCFGADGRLAAGSGCDAFALDVAVPANFYSDHPGAVNITASGFGIADLDLFVYKRNPDGTRGDFVTGDGQTLGTAEGVGIDKAAGAYWVCSRRIRRSARRGTPRARR